jgi:hypothetical protein
VRRGVLVLFLVPIALAAVFWFRPPRGDDSYHHSINAVEQARSWREGAAFPRYHRGWNGGTGTFVPTIYSPIPLSIQGGLAWLLSDGQRAVGISLAIALLVAAVSLVGWSGQPVAAWVLLAPYLLANALTRSTTTEMWALAGAAMVLPLAMPPAPMTRWRGFGLASGVLLVAGCQVGMLLQLGLLLGAAWVVRLGLSWREHTEMMHHDLHGLAAVIGWGAGGLAAAGVLWLPAVVDSRHLALADLTSGALDWRINFLPDGSDLGVLLTAVAVSLAVVALMVTVFGDEPTRLPLAAATAVGIFLATPLSVPFWQLPRMEILQFPWRTLGPTTLVALLALSCLRGRWRASGVVLLLLPLVVLPVEIGSGDDSVPTTSTPEELAMIAHRQWGLVPTLPTTSGLYAPGFHRLESLDQLSHQQAWLEVVERSASGGEWRVTHNAWGTVLLPLQWWPEWRVRVDGHEVSYNNLWGLVAVEIEAGTFNLQASLQPSRSRWAGAALSLAGCIALTGLALREERRRRPVPVRRGGDADE